MTGVELPSPSADLNERQLQLKKLVESLLLKLDPALSEHKLNYVRVVKGPKPSILEVECANADRYLAQARIFHVNLIMPVLRLLTEQCLCYILMHRY
jgi:hypothetical protein